MAPAGAVVPTGGQRQCLDPGVAAPIALLARPPDPPVNAVCLASRLPPDVARDWSLVLHAAGIAHELHPAGDGGELWVGPEDHARAAREIERYLHENRGQPAVPVSWPKYRHASWGVAAYAAALLAVTVAALYRLGGRNWVDRGVLEIGLIERGEWWRAFTALTLHADLGHLLANLAFGVLFAYPAGQFVGVGVAWLAIVLAAGSANAVDMILHPPTHTVLGASTAVFAALGLTSAFSWQRRASRVLTWMQRAAPLVAGVALLAFTGVGGERTDVLAHALGFLAGGISGLALAIAPLPPPGRDRPQWLAAAIAVGVLVSAWTAALR
jgi:membrane associated rhomboid family serine protease